MANASTGLNLIDDDAERWAARLDGEPLTAAENRALASWLDESPSNQERLDTCRLLLARLGDSVMRLSDAHEFPVTQSSVAKPEPIRPPRAIFRRVAAGLAAAAGLAVAAVWWVHRPELLHTVAAQRQEVTLADGSHVELNARTSLAVRMRGSQRNVQMAEGEAYFAVAKDPSRPFVIETPAGSVRVTGTAFNVRSTDEGEWEVTVVEGSVAVAPQGLEPYRLSPGDQLSWDKVNAASKHLNETGVQDAIAWREGRVVFESEPLPAAVERFARYHGQEITVAPELAKIEIGGRFQLNDLDSFLRDVSFGFPVQVLRTSDGTIRLVPR